MAPLQREDEGGRMKPWSVKFAGRIDEHVVESRALAGNALGDPATRPLWVYLPPGYDDEPDRRYVCIYVIQGLTGQLDMWRNRTPFRLNFPELTDAGMASGAIGPAIVVYVDAWTSLGGSQYVNSPGTGRYHDYLCDEIVPFVDQHYRTDPSRERRGIQGKSSGGYGALITPLLRPDLFSGLGSHAGDSLFEACYLPGFRESVRALRKDYQGSFEKFWDDFRSRPAFSKDSGGVLLRGRGRDGAPALRALHREARRRGVAAVAGMGPRADDPEAGRRGAVAPGHLSRRREPRRVVPGQRHGGRVGGARQARRRPLPGAVRRDPHGHRVPVPEEPGLPGGEALGLRGRVTAWPSPPASARCCPAARSGRSGPSRSRR